MHYYSEGVDFSSTTSFSYIDGLLSRESVISWWVKTVIPEISYPTPSDDRFTTEELNAEFDNFIVKKLQRWFDIHWSGI